MSNPITRALHAAAGVHNAIASSLEGITCRCKLCDSKHTPTRAAIADYLRNGWPKCCGQTMYVDARKPAAPPTEER